MKGPVLVTGGLGYIGGRIVVALAEAGYAVRLTTRAPPSSRPAWLPDGCTVVPMDVMSDAQVDAAVDGVRDIVHLVALNENDAVKDPEQALTVGALGTLKVLRAAERRRIRRFIFFSTAHVYGAPLLGRLTEATVARPSHPYAITHRVAEDIVLASHDQRRLDGIVLRLSNGFGAPTHAGVNRWTLLTNDLCRQAVLTKRLVLKSSGLQPRDFITLSDVGRASRHFLEISAAQCGDGLFNLGGGRSVTILEMTMLVAARCREVLGFTPDVERPAPAPGEQTPDLAFDVTKAAATGFHPIGDFAREIDATLRLCVEERPAW